MPKSFWYCRTVEPSSHCFELVCHAGFLPEEYDNFFVKYLYPSFTPTVVLFLAGTVGYGVLKYFESEKSKT